MDQMLTEMETTPTEDRDGEHWDPFTVRFLELQAAQQSDAEKLVLARVALANAVITKQ